MRRALGALLEDPQNNLKLFVDGEAVPEADIRDTFHTLAAELGGGPQLLLDAVIAALTAQGVPPFWRNS